MRTSFGKLYQIFAPLYWKLDFPYLVLHVGRGSASLLSLRPLRLYLESQSTNRSSKYLGKEPLRVLNIAMDTCLSRLVERSSEPRRFLK